MKHVVTAALLTAAAAALCACGAPPPGPEEKCSAAGVVMPGPGINATDARVPELGDDVGVVQTSHIALADAVKQVQGQFGPVIEAKFELGDDGALSFSAYPSDGSVFQEAAGDPTAQPLMCALEEFSDAEHIVRSARDLALVEESTIGVADAASLVGGLVYWSVPTIQNHRAGFGVYRLNESDCTSTYTFVDGRGTNASDAVEVDGPTDGRGIELGDDVTIVRTSAITMSEALVQAGPAIEAKFELGDDGALSLSIYPIDDVSIDPEHAVFAEASGDPTASPFVPGNETFTDAEHLAVSSRDLTIVQTASMSLADAVVAAQAKVPGVVFWAIPQIRDTRAGYGIYVLADDDTVHYVFVS